MTRRQTERTIAGLGAVTALSALGGSIYGLTGAPKVPSEWLQGSPFDDYKIPSVFLGIAVGGSSGAAAATAWRGSEHTGPAAAAAGTILTGWIVAQVAIIGPRSLLQPIMGAVGVTMIGLGLTLR